MRSKDFLFAVALAGCLLSLLIGLYVGHRVAVGIYEPEIAKLNTDVDKAREELIFWQNTLKGLADGNQLEDITIRGRVNDHD